MYVIFYLTGKNRAHTFKHDTHTDKIDQFLLKIGNRVKPCLQQCMIGVNHAAWNPIWSGQLRSAACLGGGGGEEGVNPTSPPFHNIPSTSIHRTVNGYKKQSKLALLAFIAVYYFICNHATIVTPSPSPHPHPPL